MGDCGIQLPAFREPAAALDIAVNQVAVDGIQHRLGNLGARSVVKEREVGTRRQCGK